MKKPTTRPAQRSTARPAARTSQDDLAQLKSVTGASKIHVGTPDSVWLLRLGVVIDLDIRRWRAQVSANLRDLGLPEPKDDKESRTYDELINLGIKRLMPPWFYKDFGSVDSGARQFVRIHSYETGYGPFVTVGEYAIVKQGLAEFEARQAKLVARVEREWDGPIAEWRTAQFTSLAEHAYARLKELDAASLTNESGHALTEKAFVSAYVSHILALIPPLAEVMQSFDFHVELSYIPLPSLLAKENMAREKIEAKRALARLAAEQRQAILEARTAAKQTKISDKLHQAQARANQTTAAFQSRAAKRREDEQLRENAETALLATRDQALETMHADVMRSAAGGASRVGDFVRSIQVQSIERILAAVVSARENITANDNLIGPKAAGLRNALDSYSASGLVVNTSIDGKIASLQTLLSLKPGDRQISQITNLIDSIVDAAKQSLKLLKKG